MKNKFLIFNSKYLQITVLIGVLFYFFNLYINILINDYFEVKLISQVKFGSLFEEIVMAILLGPAIETLVFQGFIIYQTYSSYKGKNVKILAISISAILFGLSHAYSKSYVIFGIISGYILGILFCFFRDKTNYFSAIVYVTIIHIISNLMVTIKNLI